MTKVNTVKYFVTINGQTMPMYDACAKFKVNYSNTVRYMRRHHVTAQEAFDHYYHPAVVSSHKLPLRPYVAFSQDHQKDTNND